MVRNQDTPAGKCGYCFDHVCRNMSNQVFHFPYVHLFLNQNSIRPQTRILMHMKTHSPFPWSQSLSSFCLFKELQVEMVGTQLCASVVWVYIWEKCNRECNRNWSKWRGAAACLHWAALRAQVQDGNSGSIPVWELSPLANKKSGESKKERESFGKKNKWCWFSLWAEYSSIHSVYVCVYCIVYQFDCLHW